MSNELLLPEVQATFTQGEIAINYTELSAYVDTIVQKYKGIIVTPEDIQDFKRIRADLRKITDAMSKERIRIKKQYNEPVIKMEGRINEIAGYIEEVVKEIDDQIKAQENARALEKLDNIKSIYQRWQYSHYGEIPFEKIFKKEWMTQTYTLKAVEDEIHTLVNRIIEDIKHINTLGQPLTGLALPRYLDTLDVLDAESYARDMQRLLTASGMFGETIKDPLPGQEAMQLDAGELGNMLLGMEVKLAVTGVKHEYTFADQHPHIIGFRTMDDFAKACIAMTKEGIDFDVWEEA